MYKKKSNLIMVFMLLLLSTWCNSSLAQPHLKYQNRGNRYEGIKPIPVSGYDIELISVRVDYKEEATQVPDQLKIKFYLKRPSEVHLTVRELDYKHYYWMDKIKPSKSWRPGFDNVFEWSTQEVIQQLDDIKIYDLGAVARLKKPEPSKVEQVAPVILYHSQFPAIIKGYLFTFKTNGDAKLIFSFYKEDDAEPVNKQVFQRQRGGRPFTVRWQSPTEGEDSYKLVVRGHFLDTNMPIDQTVRFYHKPVVE